MLTRARDALRREDGITLMELTVAAALSIVLLAGLSGVLHSVARSQAVGAKQSEVLDVGRLVLQQLNRDVLGASAVYDCTQPGESPGYCLQLDAKSPQGVDRKVRYRLDGSALWRDVDDGTTYTFPDKRLMSEHIDNQSTSVPMFTCTIGEGLPRIGVQMVLRPSASREATFKLETALRPRNTYTVC